MAQKYLEFVANNQAIQYIKWDDCKKKFKAWKVKTEIPLLIIWNGSGESLGYCR
jgi:hypothetical protein